MIAEPKKFTGAVCPVACRDLVIPGSNCLIVFPSPKLSSTQERNDNRHLKYVKAVVEKKISKN